MVNEKDCPAVDHFHAGRRGGYEKAIDNAHLVGPDGRKRLWWAYRDPYFPLDRLEPHVVVDSNGISERTISLPGGGTRTWKLRHLEPSAQKQDQLAPFYKELRRSINNHGVRVPILVWQSPDGLFYLRYGASRVKTTRDLAKELGVAKGVIPAVVCSYTAPTGDHWCKKAGTWLERPKDVLAAFGDLAAVGWLEVSFERIDAHHLEPVL